MLFAANVLLYVPFGLFAILGWLRRQATVLVACLLLSILVELTQYLIGSRITASDDALPNVGGTPFCRSSGGGLPPQL